MTKLTNTTTHIRERLKCVDAKRSINIGFHKESNNEGPKFKVGDNIRISKFKNIFAKGYVPNWTEEVFVIEEVKNTVLKLIL